MDAAGSVAAATATMLSDAKTTSGCVNKATFYTCCPAGRFVCTTGVSAHYTAFAAVAIATATVSLDSHSAVFAGVAIINSAAATATT